MTAKHDDNEASPWSNERGVDARSWHVWVPAAFGAAYSLSWLALGQPETHLSRWSLPVSVVIGALSAVTGPTERRKARFVPWAIAGFVASSAAQAVGIVGTAITGDRPIGSNIGALVVAIIGLVFFGGGWLVAARLTSPDRRLPDQLLTTIPPPAATRRQPREITVRLRNGQLQAITLVEGGYIARPRGLLATEITAIEGSDRT